MQDDTLLHTNTTMLSVDEALDDGAEDAVPPLIPRPATCSRPPCLKRNSSSSTGITHSWPIEPFTQGDQPSSSSPSMPAMTLLDPQSQQRSISSPSAATASLRSYSFNKGSRSVSESSSSSPTLLRRQVTFTAAPPESYDTHSADDYDRTQIECTPGGSAFDLRLSSRCKRYIGDGEEDDTEEDDFSSSLRSPPLSAHGNTGWTCLRGGSVIGSIDAPRHVFQEAHQSGEGELPSRGLRSFGGLARRGILSQEHEQEQEQEHEQDAVEELAESDVGGSGTAESDLDGEANGRDAFEAAAIASSSLTGKSPDATPKPSPSIVPRWARCTDYFSASPSPQMDQDAFPGGEVSTVESGDNVSTATSSSLPVGLGFEQLTPQRPSSVETDAVSPQSTVVDGNSPVASAQSSSKVQSATSSAVPSPLLPQIDFNGAVATASSEEGNGGNSSHDAHPHSHSSPSPLSSRCSSVDPWGSLGCGSSSDEGGGARSPMLEWSSCTSPDISPIKLGLETTQSTALTPKINHAGLANSTAFNHTDLEEEPSETLLLPATSWSVGDASSTILSSAVSRIQAERVTGHMSDHTSSPDEQDSPRGYFGDASESPPEAAEDTQALRVKPRRKSSSSSCTPSGRTSRERIRVTTVDEDGNTVTRSASRKSSSTDTSPAMSRSPSSKLSVSDRDQISLALSSHGGSLCASPSEEDPHHHNHQLGSSSPSTTTTTTSTGTIKRKSRSASRSSSRSTSATMSRTSSWNTSIEDEGALGGF